MDDPLNMAYKLLDNLGNRIDSINAEVRASTAQSTTSAEKINSLSQRIERNEKSIEKKLTSHKKAIELNTKSHYELINNTNEKWASLDIMKLLKNVNEISSNIEFLKTSIITANNKIQHTEKEIRRIKNYILGIVIFVLLDIQKYIKIDDKLLSIIVSSILP